MNGYVDAGTVRRISNRVATELSALLPATTIRNDSDGPAAKPSGLP